MKHYIVFGHDPRINAYDGGFLIVNGARNSADALTAFNRAHPPRAGIIQCSGIYSAEAFDARRDEILGAYGFELREVITL